MDLIHQLFQDNLDVVFFVYGLAFIVMGVAILVQPRKGSRLRLAGILWLLAWFGLTHGTNEWLDMWVIIKGKNETIDLIRWFCLAISYIFFFEFGKSIFELGVKNAECPMWQKNIAKILGWWVSPIIISFITIAAAASADFWQTGSIWTRYLLGFPGGVLIGAGFFYYYKSEKPTLKIIIDPFSVKKYFQMSSLSFFIYGILGGLIVPSGDFFPSNWLNTESFFAVVKIPVQVFRAVCAIISAYSVTKILTIFDWDMREVLQSTYNKLEMLVEERTAELKAANERLQLATMERGHAEMAIQKHLKELESFYQLAVGRELKMIELKKEMERLQAELEKYKGEQP